MPKVSVVTTVYNGEKYISDAIESISKQTLIDYEHIIIDDGSTDKTQKIIKSANDVHIQLKLPGRVGRQRALNIGVSTANSEYIAILDADDIALPNRLEKQANYLDYHPEVGLVSAGIRTIIDSSGKIIREKRAVAWSNDEIKKKLVELNPLFHSSIMFRKSLLMTIGCYDESLYCLEDWDMYIRLSPYCELINLPCAFSHKRHHEEQYFDGREGAHKLHKFNKVRAKLYFRSVKLLHANPIYLLKAVRLLFK